MINNLVGAIALAGLVGTFAFAPPPQPAPRPVSRPAPSDQLAAISPAIAAPSTLVSQHPPVPILRLPRALPPAAALPEAPASQPEPQPPEGLARTAARTAIEADGYKGVTVLGKATDGTWRAKAYRGKTEVQLTVDGTGRVSAE